jgi:DNA (cytosine-5)-methyltransferase 1
MKTIHAADLFCGAGGTSMGMGRAARDLGLQLDLLAVNHWPVAIETHSRNHPAARHLCETLDSVDPRKVVPGKHLHLLVASPECTHHSRARGGKPMSDQSRASAWHIPRWLEALNVDALIVENVVEFMEWGPLGTNGKPLKSRKGETFRAWKAAIESLGYTFDHKTLNAANYGDATTRERWFGLARKGRKRIGWPEPSHGSRDSLLRHVKPWRSAREIIDWTMPGTSIYGRKKPLAPKTLARIAEGIRRFSGGQFVLAQGQGGVARDVAQPIPTITTDGAVRVVEPFLIPFYGERPGQPPRSHSLREPVPTIPASGDGKFALIDPIVVTMRQHTAARRLDDPLTAITGSGNHHLLVEAFIACYYGTTNLHSVRDPLPTITTKDRFALVEPVVQDGYMLDIRVRMLSARELARATSFDDSFEFAGTITDQKKQIGNAVPGELARALCLTQLAPFASKAVDRKAAKVA